jgi:hypothetical protein
VINKTAIPSYILVSLIITHDNLLSPAIYFFLDSLSLRSHVGSLKLILLITKLYKFIDRSEPLAEDVFNDPILDLRCDLVVLRRLVGKVRDQIADIVADGFPVIVIAKPFGHRLSWVGEKCGWCGPTTCVAKIVALAPDMRTNTRTAETWCTGQVLAQMIDSNGFNDLRTFP